MVRTSPPPLIFGITGLARVFDLVYGAQSLTGTILSAKDLTR